MLRIIEMADAAAAKAYYTSGLARADYYAAGQEVAGQWLGRGAAILGVADTPVDQKSFAALTDNRHPLAPERQLTPRARADRRVGYDLNFHAPKGLSVLHAITGDERLYEAFVGAVRATMAEMEGAMQVRVRTGLDAGQDRITGNWVYAEFIHLTARPTANHVADPHLHCHCVVANASYDRTEQRWKAGQFGGIKRDANYYEAAFLTRLARAVQLLGYRVKKDNQHGKYWDLADVPELVIERFSKRTGLIEESAKARGITDAKLKDGLGARTRAIKQKGVSNDELAHAWRSQLTNAEVESLQSVRTAAAGSSSFRQPRNAQTLAYAAVDYAIAHAYERQSVVSERQLAEIALRHGLDQEVEVAPVWDELRTRRAGKQLFCRQVDDQCLCTTKEAYDESSRCIDYAREGMGRCAALPPNWLVRRPELLAAAAADQRAAVEHVLRAPDRVIAIQGRAGTGKTFATREIAAALTAAGRRLQTLAPTSKAVDVLREEGFSDANTVSQLLVNPSFQDEVEGSVLLVDEAGLLSTRQLDKLFQIAGARNCRVLLQYDLRQHRSVDRGSPVRDLERYAGLTAAEIHVVRRQKRQDYAAAVENLSRGEFESAFARLGSMEAFAEVHDADERVRRLAGDYLAATRPKGKTALVVAPTHAEGHAVTRAIRHALRKDGRLTGSEHEVSSLRRAGFTVAQRGEPNSYTKGQIIQFTQNASGYHRGDRLVVRERRADGQILVQRLGSAQVEPGGALLALPLKESASFDVYEPTTIALSVGDRIRITQNGYVPVMSAKDATVLPERTEEGATSRKAGSKHSKPLQHRLTNGAVYTVTRFTAHGDLVLSNGWVLPRSYGHLVHGYCMTSHASQGMTADVVLISQSAESFGASSREQFYVSCSRGRTGIKIYTDSVADLFEAVRRSHRQTSAADLLRGADVAGPPARQRSSKDRRAASADRQRTLQTAWEAVRHGRDHLYTALDHDTAVISSTEPPSSKVGTEGGSAVLVPTSPPVKRAFVVEAGEWVCGPHVSKRAGTMRVSSEPKETKPTTPAGPASVPPAKKTVSVPIFAPEPENPTHHHSL